MRKKPEIIIAGMMAGKRYFCGHPLGCGEEVLGFKDRASAREYRVNRLCQSCQDKIFVDDTINK